MSIDISDFRELEVDNNGVILDVVAAWDSGVGPYNIVVRTRGGGIFVFDNEGENASTPTIKLNLESDREWAVALPRLPKITLSTNSTGRLTIISTWPDGSVVTNRMDDPTGPLPAGLNRRLLRLRTRDI